MRLLHAGKLFYMGVAHRGVAQRPHRSSTENPGGVLHAKLVSEQNGEMQRAYLVKLGIFVGLAPAVGFLLVVYSLALHANLVAGEFPSIPATALFKAHDSLAMNFTDCWLFLLLAPIGIFSLLGVAKGLVSVLPGFIAFIMSLLFLWVLVKLDPFQIFNWFFT